MKIQRLVFEAMLIACTTEVWAQQGTIPFNVTVVNVINDDDDKLYQDPHRAPALADVSGTYEASSGTLSLCASFDVACVRIYKDDTLIMEDNHPVMTGGEVYYNLSFYGSGVYNICIYDAEGNSYIGWITSC